MSFNPDSMMMDALVRIPIVEGATIVELYVVPDGAYIRPIIISTSHTFTGSLDSYFFSNKEDKAVIVDHTQNKSAFGHTTLLGHLINCWLRSGEKIQAIANCTGAGAVLFGIMYEEWSTYGEPKEDMGVIKTQPRWKVPAFFKR